MEEIVIVGGGVAGLATSLGLHSIVTTSVNTGFITSELSFEGQDSQSDHNVFCVNRKILLETLESELPKGTIRYSSKLLRIEDDGLFKSLHLADGTIVKAKVLIGCDGVNSVVAKFLGFSEPFFLARSAIRGLLHSKEPHGFEPKFMQFFGNGVRYGVIPCNDREVYWFFAFTPSPQEKAIAEDPTKLKQLILGRLGIVPDRIKQLVEKTELSTLVFSPLRSRNPFELLRGNISKDNVCVLGDAMHPMTPDLGQGGCSALEDSVVLARVLAEALREKGSGGEENEQRRIRGGLERFARERKWRDFDLVMSSYVVGRVQQSDGAVMNFIRDRIMARFLAGLLLRKASYDCGNLMSGFS